MYNFNVNNQKDDSYIKGKIKDLKRLVRFGEIAKKALNEIEEEEFDPKRKFPTISRPFKNHYKLDFISLSKRYNVCENYFKRHTCNNNITVKINEPVFSYRYRGKRFISSFSIDFDKLNFCTQNDELLISSERQTVNFGHIHFLKACTKLDLTYASHFWIMEGRKSWVPKGYIKATTSRANNDADISKIAKTIAYLSVIPKSDKKRNARNKSANQPTYIKDSYHLMTKYLIEENIIQTRLFDRILAYRKIFDVMYG
jgi:hypothetical protein